MKVDNFALSTHQTCPAKYDLRIRQGYTTRYRSGALGFGGALHAGLAEWYKGKGIGAALQAIHEVWPDNLPIDDYRTKEKCLNTMVEYSKNYPMETFKVIGMPDNPVVEVAFTIETGMYLPCDECWLLDSEPFEPLCENCQKPKEPIEYGGIFDTLVEFSGQVFILEHKSTSVLGPSYFNQFKPNNQVTGYIWGASEMSGTKVNGAIINAIGIYKAGKTKFERHITTRNATAIEEWKRDVYAECLAIKSNERREHFSKRTSACTLYGLCEFHSIHTLDHETERRKRLETDYVVDKWDYEKRDP